MGLLLGVWVMIMIIVVIAAGGLIMCCLIIGFIITYVFVYIYKFGWEPDYCVGLLY